MSAVNVPATGRAGVRCENMGRPGVCAAVNDASSHSEPLPAGSKCPSTEEDPEGEEEPQDFDDDDDDNVFFWREY